MHLTSPRNRCAAPTALALAALTAMLAGCGPQPSPGGDPGPSPDAAVSGPDASTTPAIDATTASVDATVPAIDATTAPVDASVAPALYGKITIAGSFNAWAVADPAATLTHQGGGLWSGDISLPVGRVDFKFLADGAWTVNWGGGQAGLVPAQRGTGVQAGGNLGFEIPVAGPWRISLDERTGAWSISPGPSLEAGLPPAGAALVDLLRALPDLAPSAVATRVDAFVTAARTSAETPIVLRDSALFLWLAPVTTTVEVGGSWSGWEAGRTALVSLAGRAAYLARSVPLAQRHAYKLIIGGDWQRDPLAPEIEWDTIPRAGYGDFNSVFASAGYVWVGPHLRLLRVRPARFSAERDVYVWLPPGYDAAPATRTYPTLYIHDGNEALTRSHLDEVALTAIKAGRAAAPILVFVHLPSGNVRMDEYTFATTTAQGPAYAAFIADEVVPLVEARFPRARRDRSARATLGMSLGGLIAYYIAYERSDVFARVGGMSSSFFWEQNAMIERVRTGAVKPLVRCYLDSGSPNDNDDVTTLMNSTLRMRGYETLRITAPGAAHDWPDWAARFDEALAYLFSPTDFPN